MDNLIHITENYCVLHELIGLFDNHEFEEYLSSEDIVTDEKLERVEDFQGELIESDILISLLCCVDGKEGGDVTANFSEEEDFNDFIDLLNSMGLNCFVDLNPVMTEAENMRALLDEEEKKKLDDRLDDSDIRARIFMSKKDDYSISYFSRMLFLQGKTVNYHRIYGEFLGFPEENIDCFVFHERRDFTRKLLKLMDKDRPETVSDWELADRHQEDLTDREYENLRTFIYSLYPDKEESLDKALQIASERRKKLEDNGVDTDHYVDLFLDW